MSPVSLQAKVITSHLWVILWLVRLRMEGSVHVPSDKKTDSRVPTCDCEKGFSLKPWERLGKRTTYQCQIKQANFREIQISFQNTKALFVNEPLV